MLRKGFLIPHRKYCEKYGFYHFMTSSLNAEKTLHGNENMHMHLQKKYMHSDAMKSRMKEHRIKSKARLITVNDVSKQVLSTTGIFLLFKCAP